VAVLLSCLAKRAEDRPQSADLLRRALLACSDASGWTEEDARAWWAEWRERLAAVPVERSEASSSLRGTMPVVVASRTRTA
jgi:hypothetical protein